MITVLYIINMPCFCILIRLKLKNAKNDYFNKTVIKHLLPTFKTYTCLGPLEWSE